VLGGQIVAERVPSLDEIFLAHVSGEEVLSTPVQAG
jgi:hypothetical protein